MVMKKLIIITLTVIGVLFIYAMAVNPLTIQAASKCGLEPSIPDSIMKIIGRSCVDCHAVPGNPMALMHIDLSNWEKYAPEKQAAKAKAMCTAVTKDKMPPKTFCKNHASECPTEKEMNKLCNWAQAIQVPKK